MTDELPWPQRLNHIRFSALLLFIEKVLVAMAIVMLFVAKMPLWLMSVVCFVGLVSILHAHANHFAIVEASGMPTARLRI